MEKNCKGAIGGRNMETTQGPFWPKLHACMPLLLAILVVLVPFLERPILERPFLTRPFLERPFLDATIPNTTIPRRDNS